MGTTVDDQQVCSLYNQLVKSFEKINMQYILNLCFQVSCLWQGKHLLSVSLSGFINYLDVDNPQKPIRIIKVIFAFLIDLYLSKLTHF